MTDTCRSTGEQRALCPRWSRLCAAFAALVIVLGCNIDFDASVPCASDDECPSSMVCDLDFNRCVDGESDGGDADSPLDGGRDTNRDAADAADGTAPRDIGGRDGAADGSGDPSDTGTDTPSTDADIATDVPTDGSGDPPDVPPTDGGGCTPTGPEVCDGADNDCNGTVDDPPVCEGDCGGGMTLVDRDDGTRYCIDTYEASRPDATADGPGSDASAARSVASVIPWSGVALTEAQAACAAAGKRLCTSFEWQASCQGGALTLYPYGNSYNGAACNGSNIPPLDQPVPCGQFTSCVSEEGTLDQSGNLKEWTADGIIRGGAFADPQLNLRCSSRDTPNPADPPRPSYGFRCCRDAPAR